MSPVNGDRFQGSQNSKGDVLATRPKIPADSLQIQVKMMKRAVVNAPR